MSTVTIDTMSLVSPLEPHLVVNPPPVSQDVPRLPDITHQITPYHLRTLEMLHNVYGPSQVIKDICLSLSYHLIYTMAFLSGTRPTSSLETYDMKFHTSSNPLPSRLPFVADHCATIIPPASETHGRGVMNDVVEAMRRTTVITIDDRGLYAFYPPTTLDIQNYLSTCWPQKYPSTKGAASGWRNTVNQCLTHGQGWNFLTYPPTDGTKNKRHLLFERAFNGSYIVGSGQCKGLNDLKPKNSRGRATKTQTTPPNQLITPPPTPSSTTTEDMSTCSSPSSFSDCSLDYLCLPPSSVSDCENMDDIWSLCLL
jgi:hypothetical protein